jgi:hypothetical protein
LSAPELIGAAAGRNLLLTSERPIAMRVPDRVIPVAILLAVLVVACTSSPDPSLDVASFEITGGYTDADGQTQPCGFGNECFTLEAVVDGTKSGTGLCEVWAINTAGGRVAADPGWSSGEFEILAGQTYVWEAQASVPADPRFRGDWDAVCAPAPEG